MGDDLKIGNPRDGEWIKLDQPQKVADWCEEFGCTEDKLAQAVADVGNSADAVERRLQERIGLTGPEVGYWCGRLECTPDQLKAAVKAARTNFVDDVKVEVQRIKAQQQRPSRPRGSGFGLD